MNWFLDSTMYICMYVYILISGYWLKFLSPRKAQRKKRKLSFNPPFRNNHYVTNFIYPKFYLFHAYKKFFFCIYFCLFESHMDSKQRRKKERVCVFLLVIHFLNACKSQELKQAQTRGLSFIQASLTYVARLSTWIITWWCSWIESGALQGRIQTSWVAF